MSCIQSRRTPECRSLTNKWCLQSTSYSGAWVARGAHHDSALVDWAALLVIEPTRPSESNALLSRANVLHKGLRVLEGLAAMARTRLVVIDNFEDSAMMVDKAMRGGKIGQQSDI
jgi:hypothetical protein